MKEILLFFLLIPLAAAKFDCKASPYSLGLQCYYQYYSLVGSNSNCSTTYSTGGKNYLLSLELLNIGTNDVVSVSWDNTTVSNNGSSFLSVQQFISTSVTISIATGNGSQMAGIFFICPVDTLDPVPIERVNVSYNQEAYIVQQFTPNPTSPVNFKAPRKWEITADSQVALISAADTATPKCTPDACMQLIWIYDGIGDGARFIGTAATFNNQLYFSKKTTMTLYFVTMDFGSDYMAVIVNEAKNLEKCFFFNVRFYSGLNGQYKETLNTTGPAVGACLTVLNHCENEALCDGVVLYDALQFGTADFYVYAGAPNPNPIANRLGIENYSQQSISNLFPQNFAGNVRTFYLASGSAVLTFGDPQQWNNYPTIGRWGFVMTNFYPTFSSNMYGGSLDLGTVPYSYNITLKVNTTYAPVGSNAYLEFDKNGQAVQRMSFDVNTNVGAQFTVYVEANSYARIFLWGGKYENMGSYASFSIGEGVTTTTTTTTPRPTTASTSTTSPKATIPTSVTTPSTTIVAANTTTTTRPTYPPTTPKTSTGIYFLMATVFSVFSLL